METEGDFQEAGGFIPTRMLQDGTLTHRFYEKSVNSRYWAHAYSAMALESKTAILVQDCFRRLFNTAVGEDQETRIKILNRYDANLEYSGYSANKRMEIIRRGIIKYEGLKEEASKSKGSLYRSGRDTGHKHQDWI